MIKESRHEQAVRLRDSGLTFEEIGKELGLTKGGASSLYYKKPSGGKRGPKPGSIKPILEDEARRYRNMGLTYEEIGKLLDTSKQRIHQILNPK